MTINAPAALIFAYYLAVAEKQEFPVCKIARYDSKRYPERIHCSKRIHFSAETFREIGRERSSIARMKCPNGMPSPFPAIISARRVRRRRRNSRLRSPTDSSTSNRASSAAWTWTRRRNDYHISSTPIWIFSRRLRNFVQHAASMPAACVKNTRQKTRVRGCCDSIPKPLDARLPRNSLRTILS